MGSIDVGCTISRRSIKEEAKDFACIFFQPRRNFLGEESVFLEKYYWKSILMVAIALLKTKIKIIN